MWPPQKKGAQRRQRKKTIDHWNHPWNHSNCNANLSSHWTHIVTAHNLSGGPTQVKPLSYLSFWLSGRRSSWNSIFESKYSLGLLRGGTCTLYRHSVCCGGDVKVLKNSVTNRRNSMSHSFNNLKTSILSVISILPYLSPVVPCTWKMSQIWVLCVKQGSPPHYLLILLIKCKDERGFAKMECKKRLAGNRLTSDSFCSKAVNV